MSALAANADSPSTDGRILKVVTYNVQFLPGPGRFFNRRPDSNYRARTIAEKLAGFDIIGFNEVFEDAPRELLLSELKKHWKEDHHAVAGPAPGSKRHYNGGLAIATRLPIIASHEIRYDRSSRVKDYGVFADEFASKGALHARLRRSSRADNNDFLDVFVTHLESKDEDVCHYQIERLSKFIAEQADPAHPVIVMGDFNTRAEAKPGQKPRYQAMMAALRQARPALVDVWAEIGKGDGGTGDQTQKTGGKRIDYIFIAPAKNEPQSLVPKEVRVNRFLDPKVTALSDHSAVEAELFWKAPSPSK